MTTIAYSRVEKALAADSQQTFNDRRSKCVKLFQKNGAIIGLAGEDGPALRFLDWYGTGAPVQECLIGEGDFEALVLDKKKRLWRFDQWYRGERIRERYFAIGTGADAALGALMAGASLRRAVTVACSIDTNSSLPVVRMEV